MVEFFIGFIVGATAVGLHYLKFRRDCIYHIRRSHAYMMNEAEPINVINGDYDHAET